MQTREGSSQPIDHKTFSNDCLGVKLEANWRQADVFIVRPLAPSVQHHT
jgi:phosphoribosylpyrophosphate synthetase